jgi:DNA-binding SARP family transcriptional activator
VASEPTPSSDRTTYRLLGPLEVVVDGQPAALGGPKQRALLAMLLLHRGRAVSTDSLIDAIWEERPPPSAQHLIQVYVSQLRKALGAETLLRRPPGYLLSVEDDQVDVVQFERLLEQAREELRGGRPREAATTLAAARRLWRGAPLAEFAFEAFAQSDAARLEELRLLADEERLEAELALGRHEQAVGELEALIAEHPLRERLRGQLMLALYRAARQAEALAVYQDTRRALVDELGIDPSPSLQRLERQILQQAPELDLPADAPIPTPPAMPVVAVPAAAPERTVMLVPQDSRRVDGLVALAEPLGRAAPPHELVLARALGPADAGRLAEATAELHKLRSDLLARGAPARAAAFTSEQPVADVAAMALETDAGLVLVDAARPLSHTGMLIALLAQVSCDVGILFGGAPGSQGPIVVPFGGAAHDWSALEVAAWLAQAHGAPLRLLGTVSDVEHGRRDASRLLATASFLVQRLAGVAAEPALVEPGAEAVIEQATSSRLLVVGLSERWHREGFGKEREAIIAGTEAPVLLVRRGEREGGLSPRQAVTRHAWSRVVSQAGQ